MDDKIGKLSFVDLYYKFRTEILLLFLSILIIPEQINDIYCSTYRSCTSVIPTFSFNQCTGFRLRTSKNKNN